MNLSQGFISFSGASEFRGLESGMLSFWDLQGSGPIWNILLPNRQEDRERQSQSSNKKGIRSCSLHYLLKNPKKTKNSHPSIPLLPL